jgi:hypothetical protein
MLSALGGSEYVITVDRSNPAALKASVISSASAEAGTKTKFRVILRGSCANN